MFEFIDPDALAVDEPVADWIGKRLIANAEALAERGWAASYVWSNEDPKDVSISVLSTHPEYWYSVPFIVRSSPQQQTITVIVTADITGGVDLCLWVDGVVSSEVAAVTGVNTLTLTLAASPGVSMPLKAALLIRSERGDLYDSGDLDQASTQSIRATGVTMAGAPHKVAVLTDNGGSLWSGFAGETTYHIYRAFGPGDDELYTWPSVDPVIVGARGAFGTTVNIYNLGTIKIYSLHVYTSDARAQTLPYPASTNGGRPVRSETLARVTEYNRQTLLTSQQVAWLGGVGGTLRSGGSPEVRWWGAFFRLRITDLPYISTVIRARDSVAGIRVSVLYASRGEAELTIDIDGSVVTEPLEPYGATSDRWSPGDGGTMAYTLASRLGLNRCSSQDLGFHGSAPVAASPDVRRMALVSTTIPWPVAPTPGDLVPITVGLGAVNTAGIYIAGILIEEAPASDYGSFDPIPGVAPFREITDAQADALYGRQTYLYDYAVRCMYSEAADPLVTVSPVAGVAGLVALTVRTSPDLPAGSELRLTVDAQRIDIGGSFTLTFGGRSVQTADLAVLSDTVYTLTITGDANAPPADGIIYLLRIEEITP
jgi:hypothetical protein